MSANEPANQASIGSRLETSQHLLLLSRILPTADATQQQLQFRCTDVDRIRCQGTDVFRAVSLNWQINGTPELVAEICCLSWHEVACGVRAT